MTHPSHLLRHAARTHQGLVRTNNEDAAFAGDRLLVIADGMGGHAHGEDASRLTVAAFVDLDDLPLGTDMRRPLVDATHESNRAIADMVDVGGEDYEGMGTTLTALLFDGPTAALCHVGDSRAYLYRNGVLQQISIDDTFVQQLVNEGRITPEEAAHHPQRSLLLRALNGGDLDPRITFREISVGDRFLLCSDGLSDYVAAEAIADALAGPDPDTVADGLVQLALLAGAPDNVTVIVADVLDTGVSAGGIDAALGDPDPDATGPMQPIHDTQRMARVPLPPLPEGTPEPEPHDDEDEDPEHDDDEDDTDEDAPAGDGTRSPAARPRWGRRGAFALALVVLLGVGAIGTYLWTKTKYFVGADSGQVVIFRGVNGTLLGLRFASVEENSCGGVADCVPLQVTDLVPAAQEQVGRGIEVDTLESARLVLARLMSSELLPICDSGENPAPSSTTSTTPVTGQAPESSTPTAPTTTTTDQPVTVLGTDGTQTIVSVTTVTAGDLFVFPESSGAPTGAPTSSPASTPGDPASRPGAALGQLTGMTGESTPHTAQTPASGAPTARPATPGTAPADTASASSTVSESPVPVTVTSTVTVPSTASTTTSSTPSVTPGVPTPTTSVPQIPGITCRLVG